MFLPFPSQFDVEMVFAIICVDDDPVIMRVLDFQLRKHIVHEKVIFEFYTDPQKALENMLNMPGLGVDPVILITDYQMPEINGANLIRELKKARRSVNCIILSGEANAIQVDDLVNDDLLDFYISKPWDESVLFEQIIALLERKNIFI